MTSHVYITINLFNLCQQSFLPFYIYFLKCWHRLNEPFQPFRQYGIFGTVQTAWYFWNCSDSMVFLEMFRQHGIFGAVQTACYFWNCSDSMVFLELFRQYGIFGTVRTVWCFWNCSDSMVFLELFRQYGIFGTVQTVSSTYTNILKYHIQGMPTNIILQVFI